MFANTASGDDHVLKYVLEVPPHHVITTDIAIVQLGHAAVIQDGEVIVAVEHVHQVGLVLIVRCLKWIKILPT